MPVRHRGRQRSALWLAGAVCLIAGAAGVELAAGPLASGTRAGQRTVRRAVVAATIALGCFWAWAV